MSSAATSPPASGFLTTTRPKVTLAAGADTTLTEREPTDTGSLTITLSRDLAPGEIAEVPLALTTSTGLVIAETDAARRDFTLSASGTGVSLSDENTAATQGHHHRRRGHRTGRHPDLRRHQPR